MKGADDFSDALSDGGSSFSGESDASFDSAGAGPHDSSKGKSKSRAELDSIRAAYDTGAGPSNLRKTADAKEQSAAVRAKYAGVKATRQEIFGDEQEEDESGSAGASQEDEDEEDEEDDDDGDGQSDEEVSLEGSDDESDELAGEGEEDDEDDELDGPDSEEEIDAEDASGAEEDDSIGGESDDDSEPASIGAAPVVKASGGITLADQAADQARLQASLAARKAEDAQKGRGVRRQRELFEAALDLRIRAQKVVAALGSVDREVYAALELEEEEPAPAQKDLVELSTKLLDLSSDLFALRTRLLEQNHPTLLGDSEALAHQLDTWTRGRPKRKAASLHALGAEAHEHMTELAKLDDQVVWPLSTSVLTRWSSHVAGAGASSLDGNKFSAGGAGKGQLKAVNQSAVAQIENLMRGDALERLKERARTWRGAKRVRLSDTAAAEAEDSRGAGSTEDVYDDSDFYHALLRELIESRGGSVSSGAGGAGGSLLSGGDASGDSLLPLAALKSSKVKKEVDTKASKGRKLRYEVHEKIQNFMPPIPTRVTWSDEQMDRLFAQLGGKMQDGDDAQSDGDEEAAADPSGSTTSAAPVSLDGLRLFG